MMREALKAQNQMPHSLAPVQTSTRQQRRSHVFEDKGQHKERFGYNVGGVKLRMNERAANTIETHETHQYRIQSLNQTRCRSHTLSPPPSSKKAGSRKVFVTTEDTQALGHRFARLSSRERDDSTLSGRSNKDQGAPSLTALVELDNPKAAVVIA